MDLVKEQGMCPLRNLACKVRVDLLAEVEEGFNMEVLVVGG